MTLVGCDLHSRQQQVSILDTTTGEVLEQELAHHGDAAVARPDLCAACRRGSPRIDTGQKFGLKLI